MLKGKEFGEAIKSAIDMKLQRNLAPSKAEIARHFNMKPPSLSDWVKKGSVAKDKLPELWRYFSDVVGPAHWGMTEDEWPAGLPADQSPSADQKKEIYRVRNGKAQKFVHEDEELLIKGYRAAPPDAKKFWLDQARHYVGIAEAFQKRNDKQ